VAVNQILHRPAQARGVDIAGEAEGEVDDIVDARRIELLCEP
jgi:hypothetical protein